MEFHYTPASWFNVAEIEVGVIDIECIRERIGDKKYCVERLEHG